MKGQIELSKSIFIFFTIVIAIIVATAVLSKKAPEVNKAAGSGGDYQGSYGESSGSVVFSASYPKVTEKQIVDYLMHNGGPKLKYKGHNFYKYGVRYDIDPAFAVAVSQQETSLGKTTCEGITEDCNNFFCIMAKDGQESCGKWAKYKTPEEGIEAFYKLIRTSYVDQYGQDTIAEIGCAPETGRTTHCYCWEGGYCRPWVQNVPQYTMTIRRYSA